MEACRIASEWPRPRQLPQSRILQCLLALTAIRSCQDEVRLAQSPIPQGRLPVLGLSLELQVRNGRYATKAGASNVKVITIVNLITNWNSRCVT